MKNVLGTELRFWDLLGERISFSLDTYVRVIKHKQTLLFIFLCMLGLVTSDPSGARPFVPPWFWFFFWPVLFVSYLVISMVGYLLVSMASQHIPNLRVPLPLIGFIALVPTVMLCEFSIQIMSEGRFPYDFVGQLAFYFVSVQGLETIFYRFILPHVRKSLEEKTERRHLVIGGEKIDLSTLLHIEAREHHVHLTFENESSRARGRLRDIVAQTEEEDGMQPHRSWWVARDPAIRAERKNGKLILRLRDNTEVPVARKRVDSVLDWLQTHVHPAE